MTQLSTILIPICLLLLCYTVWSLYRQKQDCMYRPFLLGLTGAVLITLDNFILGSILNLYNIPSYLGNVMLIGASVWAARDTSKEKASLFSKK